MRLPFFGIYSEIKSTAAVASAGTAVIRSRAQLEHVTATRGFIDIVDGQSTALSQNVRRLVVHDEFDAAVFDDRIVILRLIQSHAD